MRRETTRMVTGVRKPFGAPVYPATITPSAVEDLLGWHRRIFGDARMDGDGASGEGQGGDSGGAEGAGGAGGQVAAGGVRTFTQEQVNAMLAREKDQTRAAAVADLAKELGVSVDDAKALIKQARDAESAQLSEAQKREKAAQEAEQKAVERESVAARQIRDAAVRSALAEAGCTGKDNMTDAARLVDLADGDIDDKQVSDAVDALRKRRPELFGAKKQDGAGSAGGFAPPGAPSTPKTSTRMADLRAEARKRHAERSPEQAKSA